MSPSTFRRALPGSIVSAALLAVIATAAVSEAGSRPAAAAPVTAPASASPTASPSATASAPSGNTVAAVNSSAAVGTEPVPAGFPSAADTGVPAGTPLQPYTGSMTITKPGTVISDALINGCMVVTANNVTIKDSKIVCSQARTVLSLNGSTAAGTVLTDDEIDGSGVATVGVDLKNGVAQGLNVYATGDGVHLGRDATLEDSYVHDLADQPNLHHDDLQTLKGSTATNITVVHNSLLAYAPTKVDNTVYHLGSGAISNVSLRDNFMNGGHYTIQVDNGPDQSNIDITGNHFGHAYHYGIIQMGQGNAVTFTGNVWQDTGRPATAANSQGQGTAAGSNGGGNSAASTPAAATPAATKPAAAKAAATKPAAAKSAPAAKAPKKHTKAADRAR